MNYYAVERSTDHLAHYGVKGMRWGVRRAIASGNQRALDRHYRKAAKKLAKLQDIGNHSIKYGAKAAGYGAAAAGTGALAIGGPGLASKGLRYASAASKTLKNKASKIVSSYGPKGLTSRRTNKLAYKVLDATEKGADKASKAIGEWGGKSTHIELSRYVVDPKTNTLVPKKILNKNISNNTIFRVGAGLATAGLAAKAAQNAHRARNAEKYRDKAERFKEEMDNAFAGTNYEGHYEKARRRDQRRRRRSYYYE